MEHLQFNFISLFYVVLFMFCKYECAVVYLHNYTNELIHC
jgi:hypothetical protein